MPRVWYGTPSARPVDEALRCFDAWRAMGYAVAATRKDPADCDRLGLDLILCIPKYPGLWSATNALAATILDHDPECEIFVTGGDDVFPDRVKRADEIASEFVEHFKGTLGVMQPTGGKPWSQGGAIERCAWSPWLGREWCRRAFNGIGPAWPGFFHYHGDHYLRLVAERHGLFWQRADLKQEHRNWKTIQSARPAHLLKANSKWQADSDLLERLTKSGFPGSELLP